MVGLTVAYADPPYVGKAKKHYAGHPDYAGEVDQGALLDRLLTDYPDGWALSLSTPSLALVTGLLAARGLDQLAGDYRIGAWVKPFAVFKPNVNPGYTWEPVIWRGGRDQRGALPTLRDYLAENVTIGRGVAGAKPQGFCFWVFALLGLRPGDTLDDLFPGSGAVTRAWAAYCRQLPGLC